MKSIRHVPFVGTFIGKNDFLKRGLRVQAQGERSWHNSPIFSGLDWWFGGG